MFKSLKNKLAVASLIAVSTQPFCMAEVIGTAPQIPQTIVNEANASIERGVDFLLSTQNDDGSWTMQHEPAITSLAAIALLNSRAEGRESKIKKSVEKAHAFVLTRAQENGSIAGSKSKYVNYSTAICLSGLAIINNPADTEVMRKARHFLIGLQEKGKDNPKFKGGIGYGSAGPGYPDLSNTSWALEALYLTDYLDTEASGATAQDIKKSDLAWANAIKFLAAVQNVPESADEQWIVDTKKDGKNDGGFIYKPGDSKVNSKYQIESEKGLRSYGSMTYAGLKSMIYAKLKNDDYRVKAAAEWARNHYVLTENPEMGPEGHYYYLQCFAKAHAALGTEIIETPDGKKHFWRTDIIKQLLGSQKGNGSWINDANDKDGRPGRWMEAVPELVTPYALFSLEIALGDRLGK